MLYVNLIYTNNEKNKWILSNHVSCLYLYNELDSLKC